VKRQVEIIVDLGVPTLRENVRANDVSTATAREFGLARRPQFLASIRAVCSFSPPTIA